MGVYVFCFELILKIPIVHYELSDGYLFLAWILRYVGNQFGTALCMELGMKLLVKLDAAQSGLKPHLDQT